MFSVACKTLLDEPLAFYYLKVIKWHSNGLLRYGMQLFAFLLSKVVNGTKKPKIFVQ